MSLGITSSLESYTTLRTPTFYVAVIINRMIRLNDVGVACRSAIHVGLRLLLCACGPDAGRTASLSFLLFSLSTLIACWITV
jgi:hypothetical protein